MPMTALALRLTWLSVMPTCCVVKKIYGSDAIDAAVLRDS